MLEKLREVQKLHAEYPPPNPKWRSCNMINLQKKRQALQELQDFAKLAKLAKLARLAKLSDKNLQTVLLSKY